MALIPRGGQFLAEPIGPTEIKPKSGLVRLPKERKIGSCLYFTWTLHVLFISMFSIYQVKMAEETVKRITGLNPMLHAMSDLSTMGISSFDGSLQTHQRMQLFPYKMIQSITFINLQILLCPVMI